MRVYAFVANARDFDNYTVNFIYSEPGYGAANTYKNSFSLSGAQALYLIGGRGSIKQYCVDHPFTIQTYGLAKPGFSMIRGVPFLSDEEARRLGIKEEPLLAKAIGIVKKKILTVVQITPTSEVDFTHRRIRMRSPSSACIGELIDLMDRLNYDLVQARTNHDPSVEEAVHKEIYDYNKELAPPTNWAI